MAGGLAAADFDEDGDIDVFVVGGLGNVNSLYRNDGNNVFTEMAADVNLDVQQWGSGPAFGDIDGDRDLDLFVGAIAGSTSRLFRNDAGLFIDITDSSGLAITAANTISATFADYDRDGDLDLLLAHWPTGAMIPSPIPNPLGGTTAAAPSPAQAKSPVWPIN